MYLEIRELQIDEAPSQLQYRQGRHGIKTDWLLVERVKGCIHGRAFYECCEPCGRVNEVS